mmetsp:Transcript_10406/g.38603  ORF Transcript_10406/g.38603 Transcript_10406/m.38603 type:complete len:239 (-) Transcript_10406:11201-11917(-)
MESCPTQHWFAVDRALVQHTKIARVSKDLEPKIASTHYVLVCLPTIQWCAARMERVSDLIHATAPLDSCIHNVRSQCVLELSATRAVFVQCMVCVSPQIDAFAMQTMSTSNVQLLCVLDSMPQTPMCAVFMVFVLMLIRAHVFQVFTVWSVSISNVSHTYPTRVLFARTDKVHVWRRTFVSALSGIMEMIVASMTALVIYPMTHLRHAQDSASVSLLICAIARSGTLETNVNFLCVCK